MKLSKRTCICTFVLLKKFDNSLDVFTLKLVVDLVQVLSLVIPEGYFCGWSRIVSRLQSGLRVLLENVLYLSCPGVD